MDAHLRDRLEASLLGAIDRCVSKSARWGHDDCALWVADILKDALGYDAARPWRSGYTTSEGAAESVGPLGLGFALRRAAERHGWLRIDADEANTGDVALAMMGAVIDGKIVGRPTTMICRAPGWFIARAEIGIAAYRIEYIKPKLCWAVI